MPNNRTGEHARIIEQIRNEQREMKESYGSEANNLLHYQVLDLAAAWADLKASLGWYILIDKLKKGKTR